MRLFPRCSILLVVFLGACASNTPPPREGIVGADRDAHGCIPSAGYTWCASTQQCERPWELAQQHGFETSAEAFDKFCGSPAK